MIEHLFRRPSVRRRIAACHLGIILEEFVLHLQQRGHALSCIQSYEHFFGWVGSVRIALARIDEVVLEFGFFDEKFERLAAQPLASLVSDQLF